MPYSIYHYQKSNGARSKPTVCFSVVNDESGKIHSVCSTLDNAKKQLRLLQRIESTPKQPTPVGDGVVDFLIETGKKVFKKREAGLLPPKSRKLLEEIKDEPITSMELIRTPIEKGINTALQLLSGGTWKDAQSVAGYDDLFHLVLFINDKYILHKIEVTTLSRATPSGAGSVVRPNSQTLTVPIPVGVRIGELIDKTRTAMGAQRFSDYDPRNNNCQDFIIEVLKAADVLTPQIQTWVKQDAVKIFESTPATRWTGKIAKLVTDLGAIKNRLIEGEGTRNPNQRNAWIRALQDYNSTRTGWCIPKRGTREYEEIRTIMENVYNYKR